MPAAAERSSSTPSIWRPQWPFLAEAFALAWVAIVVQLAASGAAQRMWSTVEVASFPRWRNVVILPTQAVLLPVCWLVARYGPARASSPKGAKPPSEADRTFCYLFAGYLLYDAYWVHAPQPALSSGRLAPAPPFARRRPRCRS